MKSCPVRSTGTHSFMTASWIRLDSFSKRPIGSDSFRIRGVSNKRIDETATFKKSRSRGLHALAGGIPGTPLTCGLLEKWVFYVLLARQASPQISQFLPRLPADLVI
jgi:hypothetical protein